MQRYFIDGSQLLEDEKIMMTSDDAHHIKNVIRMNIGDTVICQLPDRRTAIAAITEIVDKTVHLQVQEWLEEDNELPVEVTIAQGLPKGTKMELIVQKGTELGAHHFRLVEMDRSVAKWNEKSGKKKLDRYEKIMKEASEQCHRNIIPTISGAESLQQLLSEREKYDVVLFAYEAEAKQASNNTFGKAIANIKQNDKVLILIGPEGGFSEREVETLLANDCQAVRLGKRILRTETAALYALASLSYSFEESVDEY